MTGYAIVNTELNNSFSTGTITGNELVGGLAGRTGDSSINQSFATGQVSGNSNVGGLTGFSIDSSIIHSFWDIETTGQTSSAGGGTGRTTAEMKQETTYTDWDFNNTWMMIDGATYPIHQFDGDGSGVSPHIIRTPQQLDFVRYNLSNHYELGSNINLEEYNNWLPISNFSGSIDGNGYTISNLSINRDNNSVGLFASTHNATISNIGLIDVNIQGSSRVGALIGTSFFSSIQQSYATGAVSGIGRVGGLVGSVEDSTTINQSYANVDVSGTSNVGGLVGSLTTFNLNINQSYAIGKVNGSSSVGGLVGYALMGVTINNSYWDIETTGQISSAGGGTGLSTSAMKNKSSFVNWDFEQTWFIVNDKTYPFFQSDNRVDPIVTLDSLDTIKGTVDEEIEIEGIVSNLLLGDTVYVKYTIRDEEGQLITGYEKQHLVERNSISSNQYPFRGNIVMDGNITSGTYSIDVYAKSLQATGESAKVSIPLEVYLKPEIQIDLQTVDENGDPVQYASDNWSNRDISVTIQFENDVASERQYALVEASQSPQEEDWQSYTSNLLINDSGQYSLHVRTENEAGYLQTEIIDQIWLDKEAPSSPQISLSSEGWTNNMVEVSITSGEDALSGVANSEYRIGEEGIWREYSVPFEIDIEGETVIYARSVDFAGNISSLVESTSRIERQLPQITLNGDETIVMEIGSLFEDPGATANHHRFGNLDSYIETSGSIDSNKAGIYTITYTVTDHAGNTSQIERHIQVVDIASLNIVEYPSEFMPGQTFTLQVTPMYEDENIEPTIRHNLLFISSDESMATVNSEGEITFLSYGEVFITISYGELEVSLPFIIEDYTLFLEEARLVRAGTLYTLSGSSMQIKMPDDLPIGTILMIEEFALEDYQVNGLTPAGGIYTFTFHYPHAEQPEGEFILSLPYDQGNDEEKIGIYYFNQDINQWEYRGGHLNIEQHMISISVSSFSTYGVFAEVTEEEETPIVVIPEIPSNEEEAPPPAVDEQDQEPEAPSDLPRTATNLFNWLIFGAILLIIGGVYMIYYIRATRKDLPK